MTMTTSVSAKALRGLGTDVDQVDIEIKAESGSQGLAIAKSGRSNSRKLRIVHIYEPDAGGVPRYAQKLSQLLLERGHYSVTYGPDEGADRQLFLGRSPSSLSSLSTIGDELADFDIVHLHSYFALFAASLPSSSQSLRRVHPVFQPHALPGISVGSQVARTLLQRALFFPVREKIATLCLSHEEAQYANQVGALDPLVIGSGIDLAQFSPVTPVSRELARERIGVRSDARVAAFVARDGRQKGADLFARVVQEASDIEFLVVGPGLESLGQFHNVHHLGPRKDVPLLLPAADALVQTSRWEGVALVALEARALGLPVVAFDTPGARDSAGPLGTLIDPFDVGAMARSLRQETLQPLTLTDPRLERDRDAISFERVVDRLEQTYASLVSSSAYAGSSDE